MTDTLIMQEFMHAYVFYCGLAIYMHIQSFVFPETGYELLISLKSAFITGVGSEVGVRIINS